MIERFLEKILEYSVMIIATIFVISVMLLIPALLFLIIKLILSI